MFFLIHSRFIAYFLSVDHVAPYKQTLIPFKVLTKFIIIYTEKNAAFHMSLIDLVKKANSELW